MRCSKRLEREGVQGIACYIFVVMAQVCEKARYVFVLAQVRFEAVVVGVVSFLVVVFPVVV